MNLGLPALSCHLVTENWITCDRGLKLILRHAYKTLLADNRLKPAYHNKPIVTVDQAALKRLGEKKFTSGVLIELNRVFEAEASTSFTNALVSTKSSGLEHKKSKKDKRREKVKVQKELTRAVNDHFAEKAAIFMLTECESKRKYHHKRLSQSFESPQEQPPEKKT